MTWNPLLPTRYTPASEVDDYIRGIRQDIEGLMNQALGPTGDWTQDPIGPSQVTRVLSVAPTSFTYCARPFSNIPPPTLRFDVAKVVELTTDGGVIPAPNPSGFYDNFAANRYPAVGVGALVLPEGYKLISIEVLMTAPTVGRLAMALRRGPNGEQPIPTMMFQAYKPKAWHVGWSGEYIIDAQAHYFTVIWEPWGEGGDIVFYGLRVTYQPPTGWDHV